MTPEIEQRFDEAILRVLDRNPSQFGLGATTLQVQVMEFGFTVRDPAEVLRRLEYMADPRIGFVAEISRTANKAVRTWKITAAGTDDLRSRGF